MQKYLDIHSLSTHLHLLTTVDAAATNIVSTSIFFLKPSHNFFSSDHGKNIIIFCLSSKTYVNMNDECTWLFFIFFELKLFSNAYQIRY